MKTEEVKYVYDHSGPLLVPKAKNGVVYQDTTRPAGVEAAVVKGAAAKGKSWHHLFARMPLVISCLAIAACVAVIIVLLTHGIKASSDREQAQEDEIAKLKDLVENQATRLHRMQKELQFLNTRQKAYEAREESLRRRQTPVTGVIPSTFGTGTGSHVWPSPVDKQIAAEAAAASASSSSSSSESVPSELLPALDLDADDDEPSAVDVDKLPRASANKKRKSKLMMDQDNDS